MCRTLCYLAMTIAFVLPIPLWAAPVTIPHTFQNGTVADADQVNDNFNAVAASVNDNDSRLAALEATVAALQGTIAALQGALAVADGNLVTLDGRLFSVEGTQANLVTDVGNLQLNPVLGMAPFVKVDPNPLNDLPGPHVIFFGANVHIQSGSGATDDGGAPSGRGNLVVGYNELPPSLPTGSRQGGHNLIVGPSHIFPSTGWWRYENAIGSNASAWRQSQYCLRPPQASVATFQYRNLQCGRRTDNAPVAICPRSGQDNDASAIGSGGGAATVPPAFSSISGGKTTIRAAIRTHGGNYMASAVGASGVASTIRPTMISRPSTAAITTRPAATHPV